MAFEQNVRFRTVPASGNLSANQYYLVKLSTTGQAAVQTTRGGVVFGSLYDKSTAAGISTRVAWDGTVKIWAGGSTETLITPGTALVASTAGVAIPRSTINSYVIGRAAEVLSSGTTGIIAVDVTHEGQST